MTYEELLRMAESVRESIRNFYMNSCFCSEAEAIIWAEDLINRKRDINIKCESFGYPIIFDD